MARPTSSPTSPASSSHGEEGLRLDTFRIKRVRREGRRARTARRGGRAASPSPGSSRSALPSARRRPRRAAAASGTTSPSASPAAAGATTGPTTAACSSTPTRGPATSRPATRSTPTRPAPPSRSRSARSSSAARAGVRGRVRSKLGLYLTRLSPADIADLLQRHGLAPRKQAGQNFVGDPNTVEAIVADVGIGPDDTIVEIGPGLGSLTLPLADAARRVVAVEIDSGLVEHWHEVVGERARRRGAPRRRVGGRPRRTCRRPLPVRRQPPLQPRHPAGPARPGGPERHRRLRDGAEGGRATLGRRARRRPLRRRLGQAAAAGRRRGRPRISRQVFTPVPRVDSVMVHLRTAGSRWTRGSACRGRRSLRATPQDAAQHTAGRGRRRDRRNGPGRPGPDAHRTGRGAGPDSVSSSSRPPSTEAWSTPIRSVCNTACRCRWAIAMRRTLGSTNRRGVWWRSRPAPSRCASAFRRRSTSSSRSVASATTATTS